MKTVILIFAIFVQHLYCKTISTIEKEKTIGNEQVVDNLENVKTVGKSFDGKNDCKAVLQNAGVGPDFGARVGHAIHAMTVHSLRMFDPDASEINFVPTINLELASAEAILSHAPDLKTEDTDEFLTDAMKSVDLVLSHMDEENYDINGFSPLERAVHVFHMGEVWAHAKIHFDNLQTKPPEGSVCDCVMDIDNNGVMRMLRYSALAIREPALVLGIPMRNEIGKSDPIGYMVGYKYNFFARFLSEKSPVELTPDELFQVQNGMPKLNSSSVWKTWKKIARMPHAETYDTGLFLYCAVQKAKQWKTLEEAH